jgi:hypothetical protein
MRGLSGTNLITVRGNNTVWGNSSENENLDFFSRIIAVQYGIHNFAKFSNDKCTNEQQFVERRFQLHKRCSNAGCWLDT